MKKITISTILLVLCISCLSQKYIYNSYGMQLPDLNTGIQYQKDKFEVEIDGEDYLITIYKNEEIKMGVVVKFKPSDEGSYFYVGSLITNGELYKCAVLTYHELKEFATGIGNSTKDFFNQDYSIRIYYGKDVKSFEDLTFIIHFYPIK